MILADASRRTGPHEGKRRSVIDAAMDVFCRDGFAAASIDDIAAEAGVSRQTVYNHHGDKQGLFAAAVKEMNERSCAALYATLATFPTQPKDLEAELAAFAARLVRNCACDGAGRALHRLVETEGERHPELFVVWRRHGPGRPEPAIAGHLARLAHDGLLEIDDPDLAARQFLALVYADVDLARRFGQTLSEAEIDRSVEGAARTFVRAFAPRPAA